MEFDHNRDCNRAFSTRAPNNNQFVFPSNFMFLLTVYNDNDNINIITSFTAPDMDFDN